ncbi:F0F1 ATP synthase subunit B [Candidatus Falkowbacteria bacterium]|jgi:F-type H+-transporting ATPase subunit b|nr:F0F1 ATP synthase subunit B [Candidatus Falkowbacteria bacterium]MBT4433266.1 F0F1 ATP synthase subunit B [Candidatus Falkowbacteria bacterium]
MELLNKLGIHPTLLIAQIINFIILLLVLYKFLYNPILKLLKKRQDKIVKSLDDAKQIEEKLKKAEKDYDQKMAEARKEAMAVLSETEKQSNKQKEESVQKTKEEVAEIIKKAKEQITQEKEKIVEDTKKEIADVVMLAIEKTVGKEMNDKIDKKMIEKTVKDL